MVVDNRYLDIGDVRAETWLSCNFPEIDEWFVEHESYFSRNYNNDLRSCYPIRSSISTSRNGIYDVLPESLFFATNELMGKSDYSFVNELEKMYEEKRLIKAFFKPFDSLLFNKSLELEKTVNAIYESQCETLLSNFFGLDLENETNPYVRRLLPLVLYVSQIRLDFRLLSAIVANVIGCKVDFRMEDGFRIRFEIHKPGLDSQGYLRFSEELRPFFEFIKEWFVPVENDCYYKVKDYSKVFAVSETEPMVLDYDTHL